MTITREQVQKLLDEVAQNEPRVCMAWCGKAKDDCACYKAGVAVGALNEAAPDLARAYIDTHTALEAAQAEVAALRAERDRINQWRETAIVERDTYSAERDTAEAELTTLRAKLARAEAAVDGSREALECARSIMDTPIARRRLNLDPSDERLAVFRAALAEHERTKG